MKEYPSIERKAKYGIPVYMFEKIDGSNIRVEWSKKNGFYKYGSRHVLLNDQTPFLKEAIPLIGAMDGLAAIFIKQRYESAVAFFEFYGDCSFAGRHIADVNFFDILSTKYVFANNEWSK